jgi:transcriptional regulator with XRE-family HTH domain
MKQGGDEKKVRWAVEKSAGLTTVGRSRTRKVDWKARIDIECRRRGWTRADLARAAGIPYNTMAKWWQRAGAQPSAVRMQAMAAALGVEVSELLTGGQAGEGLSVPGVRLFPAELARLDPAMRPVVAAMLREVARQLEQPEQPVEGPPRSPGQDDSSPRE